MKLYTSRTYQRGDNSLYPYVAAIQSAEDLRAATAWDHVAAEYQNGHRGTERFVSSDCLMMDVDNAPGKGQPDIPPEQWRDLDAIRADLPGVEFYAVTSRSHMKAKDGRPPRPKYHLYFEIPRTTSAEEYRQIKLDITARLPYFDANATDAARMFFGNTEAQVTHCPGNRLITDWIKATPEPETRHPLPPVELNPRKSHPQRVNIDNGLYDMLQILDAIPCSAVDRDTWIRVGMALRQLGYDEAVWEDWSAQDGARYKPGECAKKWRGFKRQGVGGGYLISLAKEYGWTPPERKTKGAQSMESTELVNDIVVHTVQHVQPVPEEQAIQKEAEPEGEAQPPVSYVDLILKDFVGRRYEPIPTGIEQFDEIINGGFILETLVTLGAGPGMGKTMLMQQICEGIAQQGRADVLYFNLEMARAQLIARSLSRSTGYTVNTVMRGYEWTADQAKKIAKAAEEYKRTIAHHMVYVDQCGSDYQAILKRMEEGEEKRKDRTVPFIAVIDYLQLLTSAEPREDEVQAIKKALKAFKDFATQRRAIVIIITAHSRALNETGKIAQGAGRDTSSIEYSGDLQLSLNYAAIASGDCTDIPGIRKAIKDRATVLGRKAGKWLWNEICLVCTKNRFGEDRGICGMKREGSRSRFVFLPKQEQEESAETESDTQPEKAQRKKLY